MRCDTDADICTENAVCTMNVEEGHHDCNCADGYAGNGYEECLSKFKRSCHHINPLYLVLDFSFLDKLIMCCRMTGQAFDCIKSSNAEKPVSTLQTAPLLMYSYKFTITGSFSTLSLWIAICTLLALIEFDIPSGL